MLAYRAHYPGISEIDCRLIDVRGPSRKPQVRFRWRSEYERWQQPAETVENDPKGHDHLAVCSPLRHPGHAHALKDAFALSKKRWIIARRPGAEAVDCIGWVDRKPGHHRGLRFLELTEIG